MKIILIYTFLLFLFLPGILFAQTETTVQSPDGNYIFTFYQRQKTKDATQMYYRLSYKNQTVVEESELGLQIENRLFESALGIPNDDYEHWCDNLNLVDIEKNTINQLWKPIYGERDIYPDNYNEIILKFDKSGTSHTTPQPATTGEGYDKRFFYFMNIIVRAYNEGIAFRYVFPEASNGLFLHITGEQTQFAFPENTLAYYEKWAQGPYSILPLQDWTDECERPLTLKLVNGLTIAIGEAELTDFVRMKFRLNDKKNNTLQANLYDSIDIITPFSTPWRWIMATENPTQLIENNYLVLNLNRACEIENIEWIKPGKAIRITRLNQVDAMKYIDFAVKRNLQYVHLDAGWYGKEMLIQSDATKVDPAKNLNIPELVEYAGKRGIGVFLYVNQRALSSQLDEILPIYKKWGIKGIKFGFVQVGNQYWTTWLHNAIRKCADYQLLLDIHDEYRPTGFSRTYPNLLTQEGIRGNEEFPDATHNTILPFTRFLAGAGDYTICYFDPRIKTTHAHQLALSVVFYSPLQFLYWYDTPDRYNGEKEVEFFDNVKTVWDETKVLDGAIGEYIVTARRSGDIWFIGAVTNNEQREVSIPLNFLGKREKYTAIIYTDDDKIETRTKVSISEKIVSWKDTLSFKLKASGGVAIQLQIIN